MHDRNMKRLQKLDRFAFDPPRTATIRRALTIWAQLARMQLANVKLWQHRESLGSRTLDAGAATTVGIYFYVRLNSLTLRSGLRRRLEGRSEKKDWAGFRRRGACNQKGPERPAIAPAMPQDSGEQFP